MSSFVDKFFKNVFVISAKHKFSFFPFFCQIRSSSFLFFFSFFCVYGGISEGISSALLPDLKKKKRRPYKTLQMMSISPIPPLLLCRKFREWNLLQSKKLKSKLTKPCDHIRTKCAISSCFFFFQIFVLFFVCFLGSFQSCGSWTKPFRSTK